MSKLLQKLIDFPLGGGSVVHSLSSLAMSLLLTLAFGLAMLLIYRLSRSALDYNRKFGALLLMLALASDLLMSLIQSNPTLSLGALGALSICRIRTNTRDPRDLGFVFWAMTLGVSCSLGAYTVALAATLALSAVMLLLSDRRERKDVMTIVVRGEHEQFISVQRIFHQTPGSSVQSENLFADSFELVYALKTSEEEQRKLLTIFNNMEGIYGVNVLAPQTKVA